MRATVLFAIRTTFRPKKPLFAAVGGIAVSIVICLTMFCAYDSMNLTAKRSSEELYGTFAAIEYHSAKAPTAASTAVGTLTIGGLANVGDSRPLAIGYADEAAAALGSLRMKQGRMPEKQGEIALETSALKRLNLPEALNQRVTLQLATPEGATTATYTLCGVVTSYSALWVKNATLPAEEQLLPGGFLTQADCEALAKATGFSLSHTLYAAYDAQRQPSSPGLTENLPLKQRQEQGRAATAPLTFLLLLSLSAFFAVFSILHYALLKQKKRWSMLRLLGLTRRQAAGCMGVSLLLYYAAALPLGILGGIGSARLLVRGIGTMAGSPLLWSLTPESVAFSCLLCLLPLLASGLATLVRIVKISPMEQFRGTPLRGKSASPLKRRSSSPVTLSRLRQAEPSHTGKTWSSICMTALLLLFFNYCFLYLTAFTYQFEQEPIPGKVSSTYDYEFTNGDPAREQTDASDKAAPLSPLPQEDSIYYWNNAAQLGCSQATLNELSRTPGLEKTMAYKETSELRLRLPQGSDTPYLTLCRQTDGGAYPEELRAAFGYSPQDTLLRVGIKGFSREELSSFSRFVAEGAFHASQLAKGEEVILVLPIIQREVLDDGILISYPTPEEAAKLKDIKKDSTFHVGDPLSLTGLTSKTPQKSGYMNLDEAKKQLTRIDKTVRVGAIIYQKVGWFEEELENPPTITLLTLNEGFDALAGPARYSRVRASLDGSQPEADVENTLKTLAQKLPNMDFTNRAAQMEAYRSNRILLTYSTGAFLTYLAGVTLLVFICQRLSQIFSDERRYALLRINGAAIPQLLRLFFTQSMGCIAAAIALATPIGAVLLGGTFWGLPGLLSLKTLTVFLLSLLLVVLLGGVSVLAALPSLKRSSPAQLVKEE